MNRLLLTLLATVLLPLGLLANEPLDPNGRYDATFVLNRPQNMQPEFFGYVFEGLTLFKSKAITYQRDGDRILQHYTYALGSVIQKNNGSQMVNPYGFDLRWQLSKVAPAALTPEQKEAERLRKEEEKAMQKLADENDPRRTLDAKGKPIYNAGSPEAEAQLRESAKEQDKSAAKFKQYNKWSTNGPASPEEKPVRDTGAFDEDEPAARPAPAPTSKFAKPQPQQGTKKDDTLFKNQNQNQNSAGQFRAPDNFIAIWAHPQDPGTAKEDDRLVLVELTGSPKPVGLTLWQAKDRGYVPKNFKYSSLRVFPQ